MAAQDPRVVDFVRAAVENADAIRREAEDRLFVGNTSDLAAARNGFAQATAEYTTASERATALARALDIRDRGSSHLPYLAAWLCGRPYATVSEAGARFGLLSDLDGMIARHRQLDKRLEDIYASRDPSSTRSIPDATLRDLAANVDSDLRSLEGRYDDAVTNAVGSAPDGESFREIGELLTTPLVTGERRIDLLKIYLEPSPSTTAANLALDSQPVTAANSSEPPLFSIWQSRPHPVEGILGLATLDQVAASSEPNTGEFGLPPDPGASNIKDLATIRKLAALGETVRRKLAETPQQIAQLVAPPADEEHRSDVRAIRDRRSGAVQLARAGLSLIPLPSSYGASEARLGDPFGALERLDLRELLTWHGQRTIDDFWGPDDQENPEGSYFATVSGAYLSEARQLDPDLAGTLTAIEQLREERIKAVPPQLFQVTIDNIRQSEADGEISINVAVAPSQVCAERGSRRRTALIPPVNRRRRPWESADNPSSGSNGRSQADPRPPALRQSCGECNLPAEPMRARPARENGTLSGSIADTAASIRSSSSLPK